MRSDPSSLPDPVRPGPKSQRARLLMPIALAVAGLTVFLLLFWHPGHGNKGTKGQAGHSAREGRGSASATQDGSSPVGGEPRGRNGEQGEGWWYEETPAKPAKEAGGWWHSDESKGSGSKKGAGSESRSPVGGQ